MKVVAVDEPQLSRKVIKEKNVRQDKGNMAETLTGTLAKSHFVLVHGASHGSWCWYKVRTMLEAAGYKATCIDLKGAGINITDPNKVYTLEEYDEPLINFLSHLSDDEKVILVGHSLGGVSLTDAIYRFPQKLHMAIYFAADMTLHDSVSKFSVLGIKNLKQGKDYTPESVDIFEYIYADGPDKPPTSVIMKEEYQRQYYYSMSPEEDSTLARMLLRPAPTRPLLQSPLFPPGELPGVPRVYIRTLHDQLFGQEEQDDMIKHGQPSQVFTVEGDHCAFFSVPFELFGILAQLANTIGHGAWCWYKIRSLLEISGYRVTCLDLKSAGIDPFDPNALASMEEFDEPLAKLLSDLPENEKVILVGHSAGGMSLTDAIYRFPEKIHMAVYVAATMLEHGFSTDQDRKEGDPDLSQYGDIFDYEYGLGPDQPPTSVKMKEEFQRQIFYNMSPKEDSTLASMLLKLAPIRPLHNARFPGGPAADRVPRAYVKTLHDKILKQEQQDAMIKRWPPSKVFALESDHSPFFSTPFLLSGILAEIAATIRKMQ